MYNYMYITADANKFVIFIVWFFIKWVLKLAQIIYCLRFSHPLPLSEKFWVSTSIIRYILWCSSSSG